MDGIACTRRSRGSLFPTLILLALTSLASTACRPQEDRGQYLENRPPKLNAVGEKCAGKGADQMCLALHYVVYEDDAGRPVVDSAAAAENVRQVNEVYSACGIAFQIDNFETVKPSEAGLSYSTASFEEMDAARTAYGEQSTLLAITTGPWSGALKAAGANAWTQPPQADVWGVVMEARVADYSNILGHELGHYLDLEHVSDQSNLLNPVVYLSSKSLSTKQCQTMRDAVNLYWTAMLR